MTKRRIAIALLVLAVLCGVAIARPGGGETFSGGGSSGGGGGGGGGAIGAIYFLIELLYYLVVLVVYYPYIGLPVIALIVFWIVRSRRSKHANGDWNSAQAAQLAPPPPTLTAMRALDPDFSRIVFEDFAFRLFATAQRARATALETVAPYVGEAARTSLAQRAPAGVPVQQVVVGSLIVTQVDVPAAASDTAFVKLTVEFEANVATAEHTYYSVETWRFARVSTRHSKPPSSSRTFPCPNCGAPWRPAAMGTQQCSNCGQIVDNGRFDWIVEAIDVVSIDERPPTVTQEVAERGTDLPTVKARDMLERAAELTAADPNVTEATLETRLATVYAELNKAWSSNELAGARPFVSDALYDYLQYWVETYKRQKLRNQLTNMRITKAQLAKVEHDKWYDAVTMRLWGTGIDYVMNTDTGRVLRGSKHTERPYSEYWTLIRSAGKTGKPQPTAICNNCGAPLHINEGGECEHCGAHVTLGEFDWVLSKIEQDDTYRG
jgi:Tim44-like domain